MLFCSAAATSPIAGGTVTSASSDPIAIEYICEGCGMRVAALPVFQPPAHGFCVQCAFLCEYISDPGEMLALRKAPDADRQDEAA
jgi:hypothetical protein